MSLHHRLIFGAVFSAIFSVISLSAGASTLPLDIPAVMLTGLYSERSEIGDRVELRILEPINLREQRIFVPIDAIVSGQITDITEAQRGLRKGKITVKFKTIHYPNGYLLYIDGSLLTEVALQQKSSRLKSFVNKFTNKEEVKGETSITRQLLRAGKLGLATVITGPAGAAISVGELIFDKGAKVRIKPGDIAYLHLKSTELITSSPQQTTLNASRNYIYHPKPRLTTSLN